MGAASDAPESPVAVSSEDAVPVAVVATWADSAPSAGSLPVANYT